MRMRRISVDGATLEVNDAERDPDSFRTATTAMRHLADADFRDLEISVVVTRQNAGRLDDLKMAACRPGVITGSRCP
jgi:MoaA/NifB/PqqE/SkfB family radical SAM enzyme